MRYCQAFVVPPGGYGTMDELFEALPVVAGQQDHPVPSVAGRARPALAPAWLSGRHPRTRISFRCATSFMWPKGTDAV